MARLRVCSQLRLRWLISIGVGIAAGILATPPLGPAAGTLVGWGVLALVSTVWVLLQIWSMDAEATRGHATAEDPGRRVARIVATLGSVVSLGAVGVVMVQARHATGWDAFLLAGIAIVSVVSSWALIQTNYLLHYARMYYDSPHQPAGTATPGLKDSPDIARGIDFNQADDPCYADFAYVSVGLGMTYQISDTNVTSTEIRRVVIGQTLLAYVFGAGILAAVINLIAGLS